MRATLYGNGRYKLSGSNSESTSGSRSIFRSKVDAGEEGYGSYRMTVGGIR